MARVAQAAETAPYPDIARIPATVSEGQLRTYMGRLNWTDHDMAELVGMTFASYVDAHPGLHPDALRRDYLVTALRKVQRAGREAGI